MADVSPGPRGPSPVSASASPSACSAPAARRSARRSSCCWACPLRSRSRRPSPLCSPLRSSGARQYLRAGVLDRRVAAARGRWPRCPTVDRRRAALQRRGRRVLAAGLGPAARRGRESGWSCRSRPASTALAHPRVDRTPIVVAQRRRCRPGRRAARHRRRHPARAAVHRRLRVHRRARRRAPRSSSPPRSPSRRSRALVARQHRLVDRGCVRPRDGAGVVRGRAPRHCSCPTAIVRPAFGAVVLGVLALLRGAFRSPDRA